MLIDEDNEATGGVGVEPWRLMMERMIPATEACKGLRGAPPCAVWVHPVMKGRLSGSWWVVGIEVEDREVGVGRDVPLGLG